MIDPKRLPEGYRDCAVKYFGGQLEALRSTRQSWWSHWALLAEMFLPRRYKWFISPNQYNRGSQVNQSIVDETGIMGVRILSSGMMSGLTSPTRPWFRLGLKDLQRLEYGPVKNWLAEVERRMMRVMAESNFYQSLAQLYKDNGVFGSAAMIVYEDREDVIRCYNPCLGEFFFQASARGDVDGLYREFTYTVAQVVDEFGLDNVSESVKQLYQGTGRQQEIVVCHAIEPNTQLWQDATQPLGWMVPRTFAFREVYWEQGTNNQRHILRVAGYRERPFVGARWDVSGNDAYGSNCPGMEALPATRQLQIEQKRKAEAIDKMVRPPMVASVSMKNEPASILPGAINYVADMSSAGFKPAYQVDPRLAEMMEDIKAVQDRIMSIFFADLFMMISQLDTVRTATEIDARREEKLIQLGPVIERFENEVLDRLITRIYAIMERKGLLPEAPPEIEGMQVEVQYISMLAEAQRAANTTSIERFYGLLGNLAGVKPEILDIPDDEYLVGVYADALNLPPEGINPAEVIAERRAARAQEQQAVQATEAVPAMAQSAKLLSETPTGAGQSALSMMING